MKHGRFMAVAMLAAVAGLAVPTAAQAGGKEHGKHHAHKHHGSGKPTTPPPPPPPQTGGGAVIDVTVPGVYAAMGDAFSSGEGTFRYDAAPEAQACHRGPDAWPRFLARRAPFITGILHTACIGATTDDLLAQIPAAPDPSVRWVSFTIGGNDLGFEPIVRACYVGECYTSRARDLVVSRLDALRAKLVTVVYPALAAAFPNAQIGHVGYPRVSPPPGEEPVGCPWLSPREQQGGVDLANAVNATIRAAAEADPRVEYLDITEALDGHEHCTTDPWLVPITPRGGSERGYPDALGNQAIARAVVRAVGYPPAAVPAT
jgi:hypothetical protein